MTRGHVIVAGYRYEITDVELKEAKLMITAVSVATTHRPQAVNVPATVFGQDGQGVCQGWTIPLIPAVCPGDDVTVILPIQITHLEDVP